MAKVSNEVRLIVRLWKGELKERKNFLLKKPHLETEKLARREIDGIKFAENRLDAIISDLEKGEL